MQDNLAKRIPEFQRRIADEKIDMAIIQDPDNIFYLTGFWGYLGMEFGRPTILIVPQSSSPTLVTPGLEAEMATSMTRIKDIRQ
jgi:Xaa-Pro aminopeptidase